MPTTNPVPSTDPSDLLFNAGKLDEVVNGTANSFTDRLGVARRTVAGMNADFDAQLADAESDLNVYRADAAASAAEALGYLQMIRATSYGAYASDPATDPLGNPPTVGDEYFNTTANLLKRWNGTTWQASDINTANLAAPSGSSLVGHLPAGIGAVATTVQDILRRSVHIADFGGLCNGVSPDDDAMDKALAHIGNNGSIELHKTPLFNRPIVLPTSGKGIRIFSKSQIVVRCNHNGDGIVLDTLNYTYGGHILENITFQGPNTSYPDAGYAPPSAGYGIRCHTSYDNTFKNVRSYGFMRGLSISTGFNNKTEGDCEFMFNQYGVVIDGGATNLNRIKAKIRENRIAGVVITGESGAPRPTKNSFSGSYIESNIPYAGGYPVGGPGDGSSSVGVKLLRAYDNDFSEVYFENQEYDVWLGSGSSGNGFAMTRHAPSSDYSRLGKIRFDGANVNNNVFFESKQISRNTTDVHVESNNSSQTGNQFIDTVGFNFIATSILSTIDARNNRPFLALYGTQRGQAGHYAHGVLSLLGEGSTRGRIAGIGTETAVAYVDGVGELNLGNSITAPTTITSFVGLTPGQIFTLSNYQIAHKVTVKASTDGINGIVLKNARNAVLSNYSDSITFYVTKQGKVVEVGRSIKHPSGSLVATPGAIANGASYLATLNVPGAALLDYVLANFNADLRGMSISAYVSAADTVAVVVANNTGASKTLGLGTFRVQVMNA